MQGDDPEHKLAPNFAVMVWFNREWQALSYRYWTIADAERAIELEKKDGNPATLKAALLR